MNFTEEFTIPETMRMYPPGTNMSKRCTQPYEMPLLPGQTTPFVCQPGTLIMIPVLAIHRWVRYFVLIRYEVVFNSQIILGTRKSTPTLKLLIPRDFQKVSERTDTRQRICRWAKDPAFVLELSLHKLKLKLHWRN